MRASVTADRRQINMISNKILIKIGEENMNFDQIKSKSENYKEDMTKFLRDLVAIPGESAEEEGVIKRIEREMKSVGFDKVEIDPMGNILGYMGTGETLIGFDAHIDTVGIGNRDNWDFDP